MPGFTVFICLSVSLCFFSSCVSPEIFLRSYPPREERFSDEDELYARRDIINTAREYLGTAYRRGGSTPKGFDCSGFVLFVYGKIGITLPRSANRQFKGGYRIKRADLLPGDLVFFRTEGVGISHVGIYMGNNRFIHAPSSGKSVSVTSMENSYWKRRYLASVTYL